MRLAFLLLTTALVLSAQPRKVAITVDDLPFAGGSLGSMGVPDAAWSANRSLLTAFEKHRVPATGFVIQMRAEDLAPAGADILREWSRRGFDLGNHTYSHRDFNQLSTAQIQEEIVRGEAGFAPLMKAAGRNSQFLRFPYNHTGDTKEKVDFISALLAARKYKIAVCTIENEDWVFNDAYVLALKKKDDETAQKLRSEYLAFTSAEIDYYATLNKRVLGYEPPQVMLLHVNLLNAELIQQVLALFQEKGYRFVTLAEAQSDKAYSIPETAANSYGPMWGYRWAKELNVKVNGKLEPEPARWIIDYGKSATAP